MNETQINRAKHLLIAEIAQGRAFLGAQTTEEEYSRLRRKTHLELIQEAQTLAAAIQLRQQREAGENIRRLLPSTAPAGAPGTGPS